MGKNLEIDITIRPPRFLVTLVGYVQRVTSLKIRIWDIAMAFFIVAVFALTMSFELALIVLSSVIIHELGHALILKRLGMKIKGIYLSPLGGYTIVHGNWKNFQVMSLGSIAGPMAGIIYAGVCMLVWSFTKNDLWVDSASWVVAISIFNLLPIGAADGEKVVLSILMSAKSRPMAFGVAFSFAVLGAILGFLGSPGVMLLFFLSAYKVFGEFKTPSKRLEHRHRYPYKRTPPLPERSVLMTPKQVITSAGAYVSVIGVGVALLVVFNIVGGSDSVLPLLFD